MDQEVNVEEVEIERWEGFLSKVSQLDSLPEEFVYRGQKDSSWSLQPSLARICDCFSNAMENEIRMHAVFMGRSTTLLSPNIFGELIRHYNILQWWAQMRHHGAPTRILDWTKSPFVAAYFACESGCKSGAVWCLNRTKFHRYMCNTPEYREFVNYLGSKASIEDRNTMEGMLYGEDLPHLVTFADTNLLTDRMERQQGLFSYSNLPHIDHADGLRNHPGVLTKLVIPDGISSDLKREFMHQLRLMNINGFSLFPDLDGIGRYCTELARHNVEAM